MSSRLSRVFLPATLGLVFSGTASAADPTPLEPGQFQTEIKLTVDCSYLVYTPKIYDSHSNLDENLYVRPSF